MDSLDLSGTLLNERSSVRTTVELDVGEIPDIECMYNCPGIKPISRNSFLIYDNFPQPQDGESEIENFRRICRDRAKIQTISEKFNSFEIETTKSFLTSLTTTMELKNRHQNVFEKQITFFSKLLAEKESTLKQLRVQELMIKKKFEKASIKFKSEKSILKAENLSLKSKNEKLQAHLRDLMNQIKTLEQLQEKSKIHRYQLLHEKYSDEKLIEELTKQYNHKPTPEYDELINELIQHINHLFFMNKYLHEENEELKKELEKEKQTTDDILEGYGELLEEIDNLNEEMQKMKTLLKVKNMHIALLKKKYKAQQKCVKLILRNKKINKHPVNQEIQEAEDEEIIPPFTYTHSFLNNLVQNDAVYLSKRKFTQETIDLCYLLYIYSPGAYKILRSILPLPSQQTITDHYKEVYNRKSQNLLNENQLRLLLNHIKESYEPAIPIDETIVASVGFDAASADPKNTKTGGIFAYQLQPLDQNAKVYPVHLSLSPNGRAKQEHLDKATNIARVGKETNFFIRYLTTDGDPKTNEPHEKFDEYLQDLQHLPFNDIIKEVDKYGDLIPLSDWLHVLKNLRSRLLHQNVTVADCIHAIQFEQTCKELNIDPLIYKDGSITAMRDDVALKLFSLENIKILLQNQKWAELCFVFPFLLVTNVIQSGTLSIPARLELLEIAYKMIKIMAEQTKALPASPRKFTKDASFLTNIQMIRIQNTIIGLAHALTFYPKNISMSRLGTHLIEFLFASMRRMSHNNNDSDVLVRAIIKSQIAKDIMNKYKITQQIKGRVNFAGGYYEEGEWVVDLPETCKKDIIISSFLEILKKKADEARDIHSILDLITFLDDYSTVPEIKTQNILSGTQIGARNIAYSKGQNDD